MSGNGQLAQTGMPAVVIGGITYPLGGWMLAAAVAVVLGAILVVRFRYRRGVTAGQGTAVQGAVAQGFSRRQRR
ncbi:hypothetical protein AB0D78_04105 [Streptomyces avermitilis]|uniref:hypothetical protein n=1 Tax=Streptomyces avermitilis TaxID=33903 RepID=UPI0033E4FFD4